jgi:hypothetical protein
MTKTGQSADTKITKKTTVRILQLMKLKKLPIGQTMDRYLDVPSGKSCAKFRRKHVSVATRRDNLTTFFGMKTPQSVLVTGDILNLVDKKIIPTTVRKPLSSVSIQSVSVGNLIELVKFLTDIHDVAAVDVSTYPILHLTEHKTLPYSALADKNNHRTPIEERDDMIQINGSANVVHNL